MVMSVDGLLERLGTRYQCLVLLVLSAWLTQVFVHNHLHHHYLNTPPHHCKLPGGWKEEDALPKVLISRTSTYTKDSLGPGEQHMATGYSRCLMYRDPLSHRKGTQSCVLGYVFTLRQEEWSIVAEWGLVCDRAWIKEWVVTSYLLGLVTGGLFFGFLADRFGRRNLLVVSVASVSLTGLALHFVRRLVVFLGLRFLQAVFVQGIYVTGWTLLGELFPPRWRCRALVAGGITRPLGVALGAAAALTVQHFRGLQLTTALPLLLSILYYWMVPESLRWLLTRGKTRRARQVAAQVARHNLLALPPTAHAQLDHLAAHIYIDLPWESLVTLFRTPRLRRHVLATVFVWLAVSLADGTFRRELLETVTDGDEEEEVEEERGLKEQLSVLGGPGHLGAALWAGVEAGAVVLSAVLTTLLYRRAFLVVTLLLSAAFALSVTCVRRLLNEAWMDVTDLATALRFVGVLVVGCARVGAGVLVVEVTPTTSRASAVGLCAAHAALGEILATLMTAVAKLTYPSVPWLVSAGGCLLAAALTLLLPETSGTTLPDVVDEAEVVGLAYGGNAFKSGNVGYGRSPYWTELDGDGTEGTLRRPSERDGQHRRFSDKSEQSLDFDAGVKKRMPMESHGPARSLHSHTSSDSFASLISLVDVSRVNGNNSDTSDTSDHFSLDTTRGKLSNEEKEAEVENIIKCSDFQEALPADTKETVEDSSPSGQTDNTTDFAFTSDGDTLPGLGDDKELSLESMVPYDEEVENDFSLSVFSLKFKHIKRPISPTDRRIRADLHYSSSSSSGYTSKLGKTLVQEYISHHSLSCDGTDFQSNSLCAKDVTRGALYRAVPLECILNDSSEVLRQTRQVKEGEQPYNDSSWDNKRQLQLVNSSSGHETNVTHSNIKAALSTRHLLLEKEPSRGSLSVTPSPEPTTRRHRHPSPSTQAPTCGILSGKPHSRKEETCSSSPLTRYFLTTLPDSSSSSTANHRSASTSHPQAIRDGDGVLEEEGNEPDVQVTTGKSKVSSIKRDEKATVSRRVMRTLCTWTDDAESAIGELDVTESVTV